MIRILILSLLQVYYYHKELPLLDGFRFSGKSEENPVRYHKFYSYGGARLPGRLICRYFSVYKEKGKTTTKCPKTNNEIRNETERGIDFLRLNKALPQSNFWRHS